MDVPRCLQITEQSNESLKLGVDHQWYLAGNWYASGIGFKCTALAFHTCGLPSSRTLAEFSRHTWPWMTAVWPAQKHPKIGQIRFEWIVLFEQPACNHSFRAQTNFHQCTPLARFMSYVNVTNQSNDVIVMPQLHAGMIKSPRLFCWYEDV